MDMSLEHLKYFGLYKKDQMKYFSFGDFISYEFIFIFFVFFTVVKNLYLPELFFFLIICYTAGSGFFEKIIIGRSVVYMF